MSFAWPLRAPRIPLAQNMPGCPSGNESIALQPDSSTSFPAPARLEKYALVGPRKHRQGCIINGWLILIGIAGGMISVADGLTRPPNWDLAPLPQSIQYNPFGAAFVLAGIALPLAFAYARRARISLTEALFLWFVLCTAAYSKDFAYLRLPEVRQLRVFIGLPFARRRAPGSSHRRRFVGPGSGLGRSSPPEGFPRRRSSRAWADVSLAERRRPEHRNDQRCGREYDR